MTEPVRRALAPLVGVGAVALALAWSRSNPVAAMLAVEGDMSHRSGILAAGTYGRHSWTLRNDGPTPITLQTYYTSGHCGFSLWQGESHILPPRSRKVVSLTYPTHHRPGMPYESYVVLHADDPERPKVRLRVCGISGPP